MLLDLQPTLQNDLIILRPLLESDYAQLYKVASDPLIWSQHPSSDRYQEAVFDKFFNESLKSKGALIIIDRHSTTDGAIEIGWSFLSRKHWGGQYNKAVKYLMLEYAFSAVDDIVFYVDKNNIRSQKAVEKIGGHQLSGETFKHLLSNKPNNLTYRISKSEWQN